MSPDERIDEIEHQVRRVKWMGTTGFACVFVTIATLWFGGRASATAEHELEVCDQNGTRRAWLGVTRKGAASLDLCDKSGTPRIRIEVDGNGTPRIALLDDAGTSAALDFAVNPDHSPGLAFYDRRGTNRLGMGLGSGGVPAISLVHENKLPGLFVALYPDGRGDLELVDADGTPRWKAP